MLKEIIHVHEDGTESHFVKSEAVVAEPVQTDVQEVPVDTTAQTPEEAQTDYAA